MATDAPIDDPLQTSTMTRAAGAAPVSPVAFGAYRLLQRLGEGGMGEVWLADQTSPVRRQVAVKVVKAGMDTAQVLARFDAERQALALMDHPAIAKIFDGGRTPEGRPYFVMEYVRGETITRYCDQHRLPLRDRIALFMQLCDGVQHAHQKGIIHRDLKPSNVLVSSVNDRPAPHIIDFGIAKAVAQPLTDQPLHTVIGGFVGTLEYMSPEQAELSSADVDTRSDVYSLGVMLYELLTGALPFDSRTLREAGIDEVRRTIRETDPPTPSTRIVGSDPESSTTAERRRTEPAKLASLLRGDLDWITMRALEKDRTRRYQTVNALAMDLARHLNHEPVLAGPPSPVYRARKFVRRHRIGVAVAALVLVLLTSFAVVTAVQAGRIARERDRANQEAATARRVSDFLVGLFRVSDPSEARGRTVTAREILDNGAREIEKLKDEPDVHARLQVTIGSVYTTLGDYAAALPHTEQAVATRRRVLGPDHPETLDAVNSLATLYWYLDRFGEAETLFKDVASSRARQLGPEHRDTLKAEYDLASVFARQVRWPEAEALQRRVLTTQQRVFGGDDADTLASLNNLHAYLQGQKQYAEAARVGADLVASRRRVLGADHPSTLLSIGNLAVSYEFLGDFDQAEALYREALAGQRRVLGDKHRTTARTSLNMAGMFMRQQRYADAERLAIAAHTVFRDVLGDDNASTRSARNRVAEIYERWGRTADAAKWRSVP